MDLLTSEAFLGGNRRGNPAADMQPSSTTSHGGGLFKGGNIFGLSKNNTVTRRPSTSGGSPKDKPPTDHPPTPFGRKGSISSKSLRGRTNSTTNFSPEKQRKQSVQYTDDFPLPSAGTSRPTESRWKSGDSFLQGTAGIDLGGQSAHTRTDSYNSTTAFSNMLVRPSTAYSTLGTSAGGPSFPTQPPSPTLENITYQHIQETSSKRISTLDYLRKAYVFR